MPKRFLFLDLATGTIDAAVTAAVEAAIAVTVASNIIKITVANQAVRFALTQAQVQNGDYVYQADTETLYQAVEKPRRAVLPSFSCSCSCSVFRGAEGESRSRSKTKSKMTPVFQQAATRCSRCCSRAVRTFTPRTITGRRFCTKRRK